MDTEVVSGKIEPIENSMVFKVDLTNDTQNYFVAPLEPNASLFDSSLHLTRQRLPRYADTEINEDEQEQRAQQQDEQNKLQQ